MVHGFSLLWFRMRASPYILFSQLQIPKISNLVFGITIIKLFPFFVNENIPQAF